MDFSSTPVDKLIAYQWALSNALNIIKNYERDNKEDFSQTKKTLTDLNDTVTSALKDEQFEIDKLKES